MLPKYKVTYDIDQHGKMPASHFTTDDPVTCETFLADLMDRNLHIREIAHEGVALPSHQFDAMIRSAVLQLASRHVCTSLKISTDGGVKVGTATGLSNVVKTDIKTKNGVIHVIDAVILP